MSVTFHLAVSERDLVGFEVFDHETERGWLAPDYEAAKRLWADLGADPQRWSLSAKYSTPDDLHVNMANSNAREVLEILGFDNVELWGSHDAADLLGRCLVGLALAPDSELPAFQETGANGARLIDTGRRKGYVQEKLSMIADLCRQGIELDRKVSWN